MANVVSGWYYLSFADTRLPANEQWLGGVVIAGDSVDQAVANARCHNLHPGGNSLAHVQPERLPPEEFRNKLILSHEELRLMGEAINGDSRVHDINGKLVKPTGVFDDPI